MPVKFLSYSVLPMQGDFQWMRGFTKLVLPSWWGYEEGAESG